MPAGFDVFLSHNSKDKPAVRELAEALRDRGLKVWLDEWELTPGRRWQEALEKTIRTVRCAAVLVGKAGFGPWESPEMRACLAESVRRELPVIPVLLPDVPQEAELPLFLQDFSWVDLREGMTEAGLDRLEWGITGEKPHRSKPELPEDPAFAAYRTWAAEQYRGLSLIGVGGGDVRMRFEEVYVPLRIGQRPEQLDRGDDAGKEPAQWLTESSRDLQVEEIFKAPHAAGRHALILGHPGSGKTTALLKLLHQCLTAGPESLGLAAGTRPVFLRLRRLTAEDLDQDHPLAVLLARELTEVSGGTLHPDLGERLWQHGRLLLLLDGLDEIADEALRAKVCKTLDYELRDSVRAALSCRFAGYGNRVQLDERFLPLEVRPLAAAQCRKLVELWFREVPRALPDFREAEARRAAERLISALDSPGYGTQAWKVLIGTPLLLTLLCIIVLRGGQMPRQRVAFYDGCLRVLLERWSRAKRADTEPPADPPLDAETALAVLRSLAWDLHRAGRRDDLKKRAAVNAIEERLEALGKGPVGFRVLDWLYREAGILVEAAPGEYGFLHLGLQEYLTALEIASRGEELLDDPAVQWTEEWWQEVLLLLVGLPGRRLFAPLMQRLLASPAPLEKEDLLRACLEEAAEVDLEPFLERLEHIERPGLQAAVLRLLLGRSDPRLLASAAELRTNTDPSVSALADRLILESNLPAATTARMAADLVLVPHPSDLDGASALAGYLQKAGLRVVLAGAEPLDDDLFEGVRAVAIVWGPGGRLAWEVEDLELSLRLFSRRRPALLALRLPGSGDPPTLPDDWKGAIWLDLGTKLSPGCVAIIRRALAFEGPAAAQAAEAQAAPGQPFIEALTGIRFLWIPGGRSQMGGNAYDREPIHPVRISPFWLGETPVTNRQYAMFLEKVDIGEPRYWRDRRFSSPDQPVVGVSWLEAVAFCQWLSKTLCRHVMLPSEAQWEFAARGTDGREYPWGNKPPDEALAYFNFVSFFDRQKGQPAPVGSFPAGRGPFGTLDQAGNVWEWCRDTWDEQAYTKRLRAIGEAGDPFVEKGTREWRVLRGGSWMDSGVLLRAACRWNQAWSEPSAIGFRVAAAPLSPDSSCGPEAKPSPPDPNTR